MALFSLTDITFSDKSPKGPLYELVSSPFQSNTYRYPKDLGSYDKGHYLVIYAREQKNTSYKTGTAGIYAPSGDIRSAGSGLSTGATTTSYTKIIKDFIGGESNKTQDYTNNSVRQITGASRSGSFGQYLNTTKMTTDAIALYMPDTLLFPYDQTYSDVSLTDTLVGQAAAAGQSTLDASKDEHIKTFISSVLKTAGAKFGEKYGGIGSVGVFAATGTVVNPMLELIYRSPNFRTFQFDFMFYPRDESEALEVQKIIKRLQFHQAPEISKPTSGSKEYGFLVPPSEFEIRFYYNGQQNPNIPPISTVVLQSINLNYAPNGFSSYEVPGQSLPSLGKTGMPVAIQMTLQFKEVTYLTKEDFSETDAGYSQVNEKGEGIY